MSTLMPPPTDPEPAERPLIDYAQAEGIVAPDVGREWTLVAVGLTALVALIAAVIALVSLASSNDEPARAVVREARGGRARGAGRGRRRADARRRQGRGVRGVREGRPDPARRSRPGRSRSSTSTSSST